MNTENLGELFAALAMARQEFGTLTKNKSATIKGEKGSYSYNYTDLADIIEATAAALAKHGLIIIQEPEVVIEGGKQVVLMHGCIAHKSGAIYALRPLPLPVVANTAQAVGSAISYARRYQQTGALNLSAADDDGNEASADAKATGRPQQAPRLPSAQKAQAEPDVEFGMGNKLLATGTVPTDDELEVLGKWATPDDAFAWAVENKACNALAHAKNSLSALVTKEFDGKFTKSNAAAVYLALLRHWNEKIAQQEQQANPEAVTA